VSYAKVNTQFLARTDFATMFRLLPETERKWLETDPGELFTLVAQAFDNKLDESRKVFVGGIKQSNRENATPSLTVGEWIRGIAGGKDLLSGQHWKRQVEERGGQEASIYKDLLESMGSLGDKTDEGRRQPHAPRDRHGVPLARQTHHVGRAVGSVRAQHLHLPEGAQPQPALI
jgi:hypothetical protein